MLCKNERRCVFLHHTLAQLNPRYLNIKLFGNRSNHINSRDRRDVTALATQVNKCTAVMYGPYLFKFTDFFISLRLFRRENIFFCPATIILIIIAPIFHKLFKKIGHGWGERPSVCDHLDVKEMSVTHI